MNFGNGNAVILERVGAGGGATNWYYCHNKFTSMLWEAQFRPKRG